jgi:1-acyl-sn-glycerol-3-phosphate acyltransferase
MDLFKFYLKTGLFFIVTLMLAPFYFFVLLVFYTWRHAIGPKLVQWYSKLCLMIFRVDIEEIKNYDIFTGSGKGAIIISNHTGFPDIFVLSSLFGSVFVSKAEIKYYPIIGQIAWLSGVIFLARDSSKERLRLLKTIANECSNRILVVFPQGTTGRITERLSFNRGIFKVIELNTGASLLPVTLHYKEDAEIAWNKPQSLKENAVRVCAQKRIHVKVLIHDPVTIEDYREKTSAQICKIVERTVLGPLQKEDYK